MTMTVTDHVKMIMEKKGIDYPADKIINELRRSKGIGANVGLIYQVRSVMKRKIRNGAAVANNNHSPCDATLADYIITVLENFAPEQVDIKKLTEHIVEMGYKTTSSDFVSVVRIRCNKLVEQGKIKRIKNNNVYFYSSATTPEQPLEKSETTSITLAISQADLGNLVKVQKFMRDIGGPGKLISYIETLGVLATKPATEILEALAEQPIK